MCFDLTHAPVATAARDTKHFIFFLGGCSKLSRYRCNLLLPLDRVPRNCFLDHDLVMFPVWVIRNPEIRPKLVDLALRRPLKLCSSHDSEYNTKRNMSRGNSLSDELELSSVLGDTRAYLCSPVWGLAIQSRKVTRVRESGTYHFLIS